MRPMRVLKGKKLAGHMGAETVTIQNLEIIEINTTDNYILVSGNIPGAKNSLVLIKSAVKGGKAEPKEILSYVEEETVVDEVVEETTTETPAEEIAETPATEEAVEEVPAEEATEEEKEETDAPQEEVVEEAPAEETTEEVAEEKVEETTEE